jgi:hypothetical protein
MARKEKAAFALLILLTVWIFSVGTSVMWLAVVVCSYFGMELKGGDWLQAAASLTAVIAAIFIANTQLRRDALGEKNKSKVVLAALVKMAELAAHEVDQLYRNTSPNSRSLMHEERVKSFDKSFMAIDILNLPHVKMVEYVLQIRGMLEYALQQYELAHNLLDSESAKSAHDSLPAARLIINGAALNLRLLGG